MRNAVIIDGVRTGFGRMGGALRHLHMDELATVAIKGLLAKTDILSRAAIDSVMIGAAMGDARTSNIARFTALNAGLPYKTSATFVEMQCGSAIESINIAALKIQSGMCDVIIAGGGESHSQRFAKFSMAVEPFKLIAPAAVPQWGSPVPADRMPMIQTADLVASMAGISREACDEFALRSQQRAKLATEKGYFKEEIIPVVIPASKKTPERVVDFDEQMRPDTTMEGLAKLKPVYEGGVTTAGNASGLNDGAAVVLMMSEEKALELGYVPKVKWICGADVGVDPKTMGLGPVFSTIKVLKKMGLKLSDLDVIECNEAFAAQNLGVIRELEKLTGESICMEKWNPNGGAIAFGHPNGASGARICIFAMNELARSGGRYGLISSCVGGGLGISALLERYEI